MNEQIEKYSKQCLIEKYDEFGNLIEFGFDAQKFTELIVKECAEICTDSYHLGDAGIGDGFGVTAADIRCAKLIKNHFGVEE